MKWEEYLLKEVADYWTGKVDAKVLDSSNFVSTDNLIPNKGGIVESNYVLKTGKANSYSNNDVLVSNIRPYFKKIWFADKEGGCSNDVLVFRAKEIVEPMYLYYKLSTDAFFDYMVAGSNGTKMPRGNKTSIMEYEISLPPLPTQRRIASILSAYDDLIQNNLRRIKLLEESARCEYKMLMDSGGELRKTLLGDILSLNYGKALKADKRIEGPFTVYGSSGPVGTHREFVVSGPGVILGRKGNVGSVYWSTKPFYPIDTVYYITSEFSLYFLYHNLKYDQYFDNNDAAVPGLNRNIALSNSILLPNARSINEFDKKCQMLFSQIDNLQSQNTQLRQARDVLLPKLMSGEIDVEEISGTTYIQDDSFEGSMAAEDEVVYSKQTNNCDY